MAINILFEVSAINPTDGTAKVFRLSSASAKSSGVYLDNKTWTPAIKAGPVFDISVWSGGPTAANISYGSLTVAANRLFDNLDWTKFNFEGAQATIWLGQDGQAFGDYRQIWSGAVGPIERANDRDYSIALFGPDASLKRPLLSATYAGTGNAEGSAALTGTHKPFALGACVNVAPVLVDAVYWIYQYHAYGSCPLTAVYSNALTLGAPKATADTFAALKALTLVPGEWAAAPAIGMFRLGTDPGPVKITADVGTGSTVGSAISALMQVAGIPPARIAASVSGIGGSYALYSEQQATVGDLVRDAALWAGRYLIPDSTGKFHAASHTSGKTATALTDANTMADQVKELVPAAPVWRVRVGHTRVWAPHSIGEISPAVAELAEQSSANEAAAKAAQDAADAAAAEAEFAKQRLLNQASDGILDRTEKLELSRELEAYTAERLGIIAQGNSFGLAAEVAAYTTAYNNLFGYLNGLSPSINDTTADTVINSNFIAFRKDYFVARQNLLEKVPGVTATRAVWANVTGQGKPEDGATVGAPVGTHVGGVPVVDVVGAIKDTNGNVLKIVDVKAELASAKISLNADIATVRSDAAAASAEAAQVRADLVPTIAAAKKAGTDASAEAATVRDHLAAEVSRAKGEEGTLSTRIVTAQGRADAAHTSISEETTQRANADTALASRANTVEAKLAGTVDSELAARIRAEETTRVAADNAVAARTSVVEASYGRVADVIDNGHFDAGFDGWVRFGASVVVPSSYGRSNVVRTVKGARLDSIWGRRYTVKSRDQRFKLNASLRCAEGTSRYYAGAVFFDADGNHVAANDGTGNYPLGSGYDLNSAIHGWLDRSVTIGQGLGYYSDFGGSCGIPDAAKYFRPILFINYLDDPNSVTEVDYFTVEDVTENVATNARLSVEETARSTADTALANRVTTTEAQLNWSVESELGRNIRVIDSKVISEETARVAADSALATRNTSLEAKFNTTADRKSMTVGADTFVGGGIGDPSLLPSAGTFGLTGTYGPHVEFGTANASLRAVSPLGRTNQTYKLRARLWQTGGAPTYVLWYADYLDGSYNRVGTALIGAWQNIDNYFLQTLDREWTSSFIEDAVYIRFSVLLNRSPSDPGANTVPGATTRVLEASVENVSTVRAADAATNARITAEETARSTADSAIANRTSALEAQMNDQSDSWLRARIREEATARADGDSAIANRASTLEAQFRGEQASALKTLIDAGKNNLALTDWWQAGAGIAWPQSSGENQIYTVPDFQNAWDLTAPDGNSGDIWLCRATTTDAGGGWNAGKSVRLDPDKTYRFTIPIAQLDNVRRYSYWGTDNVCELNTGTHHPNPYFAVMGMNQPNRWYLFVGYIFPRNSQNKTNEGAGVWDTVTGEKVASGSNYCFNPDGRQPDFRAYQYYTTPGTYQAFGRPLIECVDGSESNFMNAFKAIKQARAADARIIVEETTRANADSALANRLSTTEAQFRREIASPLNTTVDSLVNANDYRYREIIQTNTRITNEETTRANADSALGNRISNVEASYVTQSQLRVSDMDLHFDAHIPANDAWAPNVSGTGTLDGRITKTVAWNSVSCLYWDVQGGAEVYSRKTIPVDPTRKYRMKARFGAYNTGSTGNGDRFYIGFVGIDAYGNVLDHSPNGTYRYSVCPGEVIVDGNIVERSVVVTGEGNDSLLKFPPGTRQIRLLIFMNYDGRAVSSYVDYFTIEEVTEIDARVSEEATARANADSALSSRISTVEANYVSPESIGHIAQARVNDEAVARADADSALAGRIATTEAQFRGDTDSTIAARIRDEASVRANADSALATRASNVEARAGSLESRTGINETAIVDAKNKLAAARLELSAVSPGGRAAITLRSDNNSGAGVDIVGDVNFSGKLNVGATSGARLEIRDNVIKIYDENGALVGKIGNLAL